MAMGKGRDSNLLALSKLRSLFSNFVTLLIRDVGRDVLMIEENQLLKHKNRINNKSLTNSYLKIYFDLKGYQHFYYSILNSIAVASFHFRCQNMFHLNSKLSRSKHIRSTQFQRGRYYMDFLKLGLDQDHVAMKLSPFM